MTVISPLDPPKGTVISPLDPPKGTVSLTEWTCHE